MIGERIGHYQILEKLGSGGMGEVWLAEDTRLDRQVAIKFLPHHAAREEVEKARFFQEAKAAARLSHASIAQVHEITEEDGQLYLVMEYVPGGSLRDVLDEVKRKSLPLEKILTWIRQTAEGLAEAHGQGTIHRDIKPDNLMLTAAEDVKITDFGLARIETTTRLTAAGTTLGTVNYMSPEQVTGGEVDHRADLFSLGATAYELITGQQAFEGTDAASTYFAILNKPTEPLSRFRRDLPEGVHILVEKLLQKDPALRYQSAADVVGDIKRMIKESDSVQVTPVRARTLLERLNAIPDPIRVALLLAAVGILLQIPVKVSDYRKLILDEKYTDLVWFHGVARHGSVVPGVLFTSDFRTRSLSEGLEELKATRSVEAHIAAILLSTSDQAIGDFNLARTLDPTNAALAALYSQWIYASGNLSPEAVEMAEEALRLDPENGAYALLVAVGKAMYGELEEAEAMLVTAVSAPRFSLNWSRHLGAVYRSLVTADLLFPSWQAQTYLPRLGFINLLARTYLHGYSSLQSYNQEAWQNAWSESRPADLISRGRLMESLGYRLLGDKTGHAIHFFVGRLLVRAGLDAQLTVAVDDSHQSAQLQNRLDAMSTMSDMIRSQAFREYRSWYDMDIGTETVTVYSWAIYMLIWSLILWIAVNRYQRNRRRQAIPRAGDDNTRDLSLAMLWTAGSWSIILFVPTPFSTVSTIVGLLCIGLMIGGVAELVFPWSVLKHSRIPARYVQKDRAPAIRWRILGLALFCLLLGTSWVIPDIDWYETSTISIWDYWPIVIPTLAAPFSLWYVMRRSPARIYPTFWTLVFTSLAILFFIASLLVMIESVPIGEAIQRWMHTPEPSWLEGTLPL